MVSISDKCVLSFPVFRFNGLGGDNTDEEEEEEDLEGEEGATFGFVSCRGSGRGYSGSFDPGKLGGRDPGGLGGRE